MIVSLVWYRAPHSRIAGGTTARAPAAITTAQKKELNAIKAEVNKVSALIRGKKLEDAEKSLDEAETKLDEYIKQEETAY